jgi:O-antigen ligase
VQGELKMPSVEKSKTSYSKSLMFLLACTSVFVYIVSAIAFEMTEETARISTLAIYAVFAVGLLFLLLNNKIILNEYSIFLIIFCLYVYLECMAPNTSKSNGMQVAYWVLTCAIACLMIFWMTVKYSAITNYAMVAYVIGALILAGRLISEYGGIAEIIEIASEKGENRIGNLMGNENAIGLFFANGILCSLIFIMKKPKILVRILLIVAMVALAAMLLLTGSRKSVVLALTGILLIVFLNYRNASITKKVVVALVVVAALIGAYKLITTLPMFSTINERFDQLFKGFLGEDTSYDTDMTRKYYISRGLEAFYEKPIFGHGTGYSYVLFGTYSHNNFVELLMNYGIIGFCLHYVPYVFLIVGLFKLALKKDITAIYFITYIGLQLILGIGWVSYYDRPAQIVSALAFAYLFIKKREGGETNENKKLV